MVIHTPFGGVFKSRETEGRPSDTNEKERPYVNRPPMGVCMDPEGVHFVTKKKKKINMKGEVMARPKE